MGKRKSSRANTRNVAKKAKHEVVRTATELLQQMLHEMAQVG